MWWWIWVPRKEKMCSRFEWWPVVLSGFSAKSCHSGERSQGSWGMTDTGGWMPASVGRSLQSTESGASRTASSLNNKTNYQWRKNILMCLFYICNLLSFNTLNDPICSLYLEFQFSRIFFFLLQLYIISIQIILNTWNAYICRVGKGRVDEQYRGKCLLSNMNKQYCDDCINLTIPCLVSSLCIHLVFFFVKVKQDFVQITIRRLDTNCTKLLSRTLK